MQMLIALLKSDNFMVELFGIATLTGRYIPSNAKYQHEKETHKEAIVPLGSPTLKYCIFAIKTTQHFEKE